MVQWIPLAGKLLLLDAEGNMNKFEKDTRVMRDFKELNIHEDDRLRGIVLADPRIDVVTGEEKVYVKWDRTPWRGTNPEEVLTQSLLLEAEGDEKYSKLEAECNEAEKAVAAKLKEAAKLISEAGTIASLVGCDDLTSMYEAVRPLYSAMDSVGWNSSSFTC